MFYSGPQLPLIKNAGHDLVYCNGDEGEMFTKHKQDHILSNKHLEHVRGPQKSYKYRGKMCNKNKEHDLAYHSRGRDIYSKWIRAHSTYREWMRAHSTMKWRPGACSEYHGWAYSTSIWVSSTADAGLKVKGRDDVAGSVRETVWRDKFEGVKDRLSQRASPVVDKLKARVHRYMQVTIYTTRSLELERVILANLRERER